MSTALFPLNAVLCPGGRIPLRIFEPRYLDMVKRSLRDDASFVIVMLKPEAKGDFELPFYEKGTLAKVVDFDQGKDGLLHITVEGVQQVHILSAHRADNDLWLGELESLEGESLDEAPIPVPNQYEELTQVLKALVQHPAITGLNLDIDFEDSRQVGWRLTELLPLDNSQKQYLFEIDDPIYRLQKISDQLSAMSS